MQTRKPLLFAILFLCSLSSTASAQTKSDFEYHIVGNAADVKTKTAGGLALVGGGTDVDGTATLRGKNTAYFLRVSTRPEVYKKPEPLTYRNISVYRISGQAIFNLKSWNGAGGTAYEISVDRGTLISTQPENRIY